MPPFLVKRNTFETGTARFRAINRLWTVVCAVSCMYRVNIQLVSRRLAETDFASKIPEWGEVVDGVRLSSDTQRRRAWAIY